MTLTVKTLVANRHHNQLLAEAYESIFMAAFPDPNERESLEKLQESLKGGNSNAEIIVNILGVDLDQPGKRVIKGISIAYYYPKQQVGLLAYNAIAPSAREKGLGKLMVDSRIQALKAAARRRGHSLRGAFIEVNDPAKVDAAHDSMNPADRVAIFTRFGARDIPIDYVQPALSADTLPCDYLKLMSYPVDGQYADADAVRGYVQGIFQTYARGADITTDPHYQRMMTQLDVWPGEAHIERVTPGYAEGLPVHKRQHGVSPAERVRYAFSDFKLLLSRGPRLQIGMKRS